MIEGAQIGYVSFTSLLWKKVSPEANNFVQRLTKPKNETFERLLVDRFIQCNASPILSQDKDLPVDNIAKIRKLFLLQTLESVVIAIKQKRVLINLLEQFSKSLLQEVVKCSRPQSEHQCSSINAKPIKGQFNESLKISLDNILSHSSLSDKSELSEPGKSEKSDKSGKSKKSEQRK